MRVHARDSRPLSVLLSDAARRVLPRIEGHLGLSRVLVQSLIVLAAFSSWASAAPPESLVPADSAVRAATDQLPGFYPGAWQYVTHYTLVDLDDRPAAYAVLFSRAGAPPPTLAQIDASITSGQKRLRELRASMEEAGGAPGSGRGARLEVLRGEFVSARHALYGKGDYATVYTGARDSMPVIRKCHDGLPDFLVEVETAQDHLRRDSQTSSYVVARPLFLSPFAVTYEVAPAADPTITSGSAPTSSLILDLQSGRTMSKADLKARRLTAQQSRYLSSEEATHEDALSARNARAWSRYLQPSRLEKSETPPRSPGDGKPDGGASTSPDGLRRER